MKPTPAHSHILAAILLLFSVMLNAQPWQWAQHYGGFNEDNARLICTDDKENIYMMGSFFLPYAVFGNDTIAPNGAVDIFILKTDPLGNVVWVKTAGSSDNLNGSHDGANDILYEPETNSVFVTGTMDGSNGKVSNCSLGGGDKIFLSKMDMNGNCEWARGFAYQGDASGIHMCSDHKGNIYMAGNTNDSSHFDDVWVPCGGFIAKFRSDNGSLLWVKHVSDINGYLMQIQYFNSNLYVGGISVSDTLNLDKLNLKCNFDDPFISKFDTSGNVLWAKTMGGKFSDYGGSIGLDREGNIYTTGTFKDTAFFDTIKLVNTVKCDWYIVKYNNIGRALWAKQGHITGDLVYSGFNSTSDNGNVYAIGTFSGNAKFGEFFITAISPFEMFLTRFTSDGHCLGVDNVPNTFHGGISMNTDKSVLITGTFKGIVHFGDFYLESYGASDVYLAKHDALTSTSQPLESPQKPSLTIFSNPTTGKCTVTIPQEFLHEKQLTLQVFDLQGKLIEKTTVNLADGKISLNLEAQAKGVYQVVLDNGRKRYMGKVVFE